MKEIEKLKKILKINLNNWKFQEKKVITMKNRIIFFFFLLKYINFFYKNEFF